MAAAQPITIVGGGLAGLTLGIGLRQRAVPVTILEAGKYPRHRVCGEFISGRGQATLARLGLEELLADLGAVRASTTAFFTEKCAGAPHPLPTPAVCISRFALDAALARHFENLGGTLRTDQRVNPTDFAVGTVRATGRCAPKATSKSRWFGLKIHARNVALTADLEMHFTPHGYVGLGQLAAGEINICGLFRQHADRSGTARNRWDLLRGQPGSPLHERLATAQFDATSGCAVAGLSLRPQRSAACGEICIGDAVTMIPPVTGNGMSMAFESAEFALAPLVGWSRGELSWTEAREKIIDDCDRSFAARLFWAQWLQRLVLTSALQHPLHSLAEGSAWFRNRAFAATR